ncbi:MULTISPECIES: hypothetical protein [Cytobacillus]|nr:hypothetical protein [Cytobacillus firmus]
MNNYYDNEESIHKPATCLLSGLLLATPSLQASLLSFMFVRSLG